MPSTARNGRALAVGIAVGLGVAAIMVLRARAARSTAGADHLGPGAGLPDAARHGMSRGIATNGAGESADGLQWIPVQGHAIDAAAAASGDSEPLASDPAATTA